MTFDLRLANSWEDQNQFTRNVLGVTDPTVHVGLYHGVGHALLDILYGLKEFWPLKKTIVVVTNGDPYLLSCLRSFVRDGFTIQKVNSTELIDTQTWVNQLKTDTLAVVYSADHAFTGEILVDASLAEKLSQKKIYSLEIQHSIHAYQKKTVFPWNIQVQNYFPDLSVVMQGQRVKMFQHSAQLLDWSHRSLEVEFNKWKAQHLENPDLVLNFEEKVQLLSPVKVFSYFKKDHKSRLWDRAVVKIPSVSGDYFIQKLAQNLGVGLDVPGFELNIETSHLCRWKAFEEFEWWGPSDIQPQELQSLIVIASPFLKSEQFLDRFSEVISACQRDCQII